MRNGSHLALPNTFGLKIHKAPISHPVTMIQQGAQPTMHVIGGMTPLETMVCGIAGGMPESSVEHVVGRAQRLLDECARVQGGIGNE